MNDNEIVKALECSPLNDIGGCRKIDALDLINRQKAEIINRTEEYNDMLEQRNKVEEAYELCKQEYDSMLTANRNLMAEIEVLKKIQQKILSKQGDYTTNNATVCEDCEKLWINALLRAKSEAYKEFAEQVKALFIPEDDVRVEIDNLVKEMTEQTTFEKVEHNSLCETETYKGGE